jgi:putative ABC transport system permease protein
MPFNVARKLKPRSDDIMILAVARQGMMDEAKDQITDLLRVRRQVSFGQPNSFGLETAELLLSNFRSILSGVAIAMVVVSSVGLMVGGIGVMNIMLVSVTERTKEIGIRKSLGARKTDILRQFLVEAVTLSALGGITGVILAWIVGRILTQVFFPTYLSVLAAVVAVGVSGIIGVLSGIFPAWQAAKLDPIEALRAD